VWLMSRTKWAIAIPKTTAAATISTPPTTNQAALGRFLVVGEGASYGERYSEWGW